MRAIHYLTVGVAIATQAAAAPFVRGPVMPPRMEMRVADHRLIQPRRGLVMLPRMEMRAAVAPEQALPAPDGRVWLIGGFDHADGVSTGDLVRLGADGGFDREPLPRWLSAPLATPAVFPAGRNPFCLTNGQVLLPAGSGGWLRMDATGRSLGRAFPEIPRGETVVPQFERDGLVWLVRFTTEGSRLTRVRAADGGADASFQSPGGWPAGEIPVQAAPAPDGAAWVLSIPVGWPGSPFAGALSYSSPGPAGHVVRVAASGVCEGTVELRREARLPDIQPLADGGFMVHYGDDRSRWVLWPAPQATTHRLERRAADGSPLFVRNFAVPVGARFSWALGEDNSFAVTDGTTAAGPRLRKFGVDGLEDTGFSCEGSVWSVLSLPEGKWLVNGLRRLLPDGVDDPAWVEPALSRPARVIALEELPGGRVLAAGDFSLATGQIRNRLAVFRADGALDRSFVPDERIGEVMSVAVAGGTVYVVSSEMVAYGNGVVSNLLKLRRDGSLDETYRPSPFTGGLAATPMLVGPNNAARFVRAIGSKGDILAGWARYGGDVFTETIFRLRPDGTPRPGFAGVSRFNVLGKPLVLSTGKFVLGGSVYDGNGKPEHSPGGDNTGLTPLCELPGGVLFVDAGDGSAPPRLRLWNGRGWDPGYAPPGLEAGSLPTMTATAGPGGSVYLTANLASSGTGLVRLLPNGRLDAGFRMQRFSAPTRQTIAGWWLAGDAAKLPYRPLAAAADSPPGSLLYQPWSGRLWAGGSFTVAGGLPRDGLAIFGSGRLPRF